MFGSNFIYPYIPCSVGWLSGPFLHTSLTYLEKIASQMERTCVFKCSYSCVNFPICGLLIDIYLSKIG